MEAQQVTANDSTDISKNETPTEQTLGWSSPEEMFPLPIDANELEAAAVFAKRDEWENIRQRNAELETANRNLVSSVESTEKARRRDVDCLEVAMTTLAQISVLGSELTSQVKRTPSQAEPSFSTDRATFTVRIEDDTFHLDMASTQKGVKPTSIPIDKDGLSAEALMAVVGYMTLTQSMALPKRAGDTLIEPNRLEQVLERLAGAGDLGEVMAMFARQHHAGMRGKRLRTHRFGTPGMSK